MMSYIFLTFDNDYTNIYVIIILVMLVIILL